MARRTNRVAWGLVVLFGALVAPLADAGSDRERPNTQPILIAHGEDGTGSNGLDVIRNVWSPDRRYVARMVIEMPNRSELGIIDARSGRTVIHCPDFNDFLWVPHRPHRLVVAGGGPFGNGYLWMWEGGQHRRRLRPVRRPKDEMFSLFGATRDGEFIVYGHGPSGDLETYDPPHLRRWMRLPRVSSRRRPAPMPSKRQRLYWVARYMGAAADLRGAVLAGANLTGANLEAAWLARANLAGADLSKARMWNADLTRANLHAARLVGADLRAVDLANADLTSADLTGAILEKQPFAPAQLGGARYNTHTRWPKGFDPVKAGAVLVR